MAGRRLPFNQQRSAHLRRVDAWGRGWGEAAEQPGKCVENAAACGYGGGHSDLGHDDEYGNNTGWLAGWLVLDLSPDSA